MTIKAFILLWITFTNVVSYQPLIPDSANNVKLQHLISEFLSYPDHGLLNPVHISEEEPFVFIHQRKTGGSDLRDRLVNIALAKGLSRNVPCYTTDCDTYSIVQHDDKTRFNYTTGIWDQTPSPMYAINAGHFPWSETNNFKRHSDYDIFKDRKFSCVTIFRKPVTRLVSCIKYRFKAYLQTHGFSRINDIPLGMFEALFARATDAFGTNCLNEPFRMLSVFALHQTLRHALRCHPGIVCVESNTGAEVPELIAAVCIGVVEIPDSFLLLQRKFPQLAEAFNISAKPPPLEPLDGDHRRVLERYSHLEHMLYGAVYRKVEGRVLALKKDSST